MIETNDQCADAEWPNSSPLRVTLLHTGDVLGDVIDGDRVLQVQTMGLCLYPGLVDEDSRVGVQSGEGKADVSVDETDLRGCDPGILQLHR